MRWAEFEWAPPSSENAVPPAFVDEFSASMPARYGVLFDARAVRRHAAVAFRRGNRLAAVELWRSLPDGSAAFCVVADDRPGLLSAIAAALVLHRLDVITALVFSRALPSGATEAVDLVWVRRASAADAAEIGADEAQSIAEVLSAILAGSISVEEIAADTSVAAPPAAREEAGVVVDFEPDGADSRVTLVVEAPDRPGMLLSIAFELFQQGAQIARSLVRTARGRAYNRFELTEFSGRPLSLDRRDQIRAAVYAALALADATASEGSADDADDAADRAVGGSASG